MNYITLAQFIFAIGTLLLIRAVYKNRKILRGYDFLGSFLTWLAMTFVLYQFVEWQDWIGTGAGLMQWIFWLFVTLFTLKNNLPFWKMRIKHWKRERWHRKVLRKIERDNQRRI